MSNKQMRRIKKGSDEVQKELVTQNPMLQQFPHFLVSPIKLNPSFLDTLPTGLVGRVLLLGEEKQPQLQRYGERGLTGLAE